MDIEGHWAKREIIIAANNGWVSGYNGMFRPNDLITRAEAMTLVNNVLMRNPESVEDMLPGMIVRADNLDPKKWYYLAVQEATNGHDYERKEDPTYEKWIQLHEAHD